MRLINKAKLSAASAIVVIGVTGIGSAFAADLITVPTSTASTMPIHDQQSFDWTGFYAGVLGGVQDSTAGGTQWTLGLQAGVNLRIDDYLLGSEIALQGLAGGAGNTSYGQILGRAGFLPTDDLAVFGVAGYGIDLGPPAEQDILLGGGLELAVTESLSLRAQYLHGFPVEGGNPKDQVTMGANFHF